MSVYQEMKGELISLNKQFDKFAENLNKLMRVTIKQNGNLIEHAKKMKVVSKATKEFSKATDEAEKSQRGLAKMYKKNTDGTREYSNWFGKVYDKLTSADEQVKLFGLHAATVRRVMYGFLPPGMFRMINKLSTGFRFVDIQLRKVKKSSKDGKKELGFLGKAYQKFGKMTSLKVLGQIGEGRKQHLEDAKQHFAQSTTGRRVASPLSSSYVAPDEAAQRGFESLKKAQGAKAAKRREVGHLLTAGVFRKSVRMERLKARKDRKDAIVNGWKGIGGVKGIWKGVKNFMTVILRSALFFTQMAFLAILTIGAFFVLWKEFKEPIMRIITAVWSVITVGFGLIWEGIQLIWEGAALLFSAFFGDGDLGDALEGVMSLLEGLGRFVIGLVTVFIGPFLTFLGGLIVEAWNMIVEKVTSWWDDFKNGDWKTKLKMIMKILTAGLVIWAMIAMYQAGMGLAIVVGIGLILWKVAKWIIDWIPGLAGGGAGSGLTVVGEKGPELVGLPKGSKVHSNKDSRKMASSGTVNHFNITVNAKDTSDAEMKRIAEKVGKIVFKEIGRRTPFGY